MENFSSWLNRFQKEILQGNLLSIATAFLAIFIIYYILKRILFPPKGKAPPSLSGLPFLGNAIEFGVDPITLLKDGFKKHGDVFSATIFGETLTILASSEGHELFFKAKEEEFSACKVYKFTVPVFGKNVVYDVPPDVLLEQRKFVGGGLTVKRFKSYVPIIEEETSAYFTSRWGDSGEAELMSDFNEVTVLTSTRCLQGKEIRDISDEFAKLYWDLDKALNAIGFFFPNIPLPTMIGRDRARKKMGQIFLNVIKKRRENPGEEQEDLIQTLMNCQYKDGRVVPDEEIVGMMIALLLAGQHTSNVTGAWTGVHLLSHPHVLEKALEEQKNITGPLQYDDIKNAHYLDSVVKETLRLRPPIIMMMRRILKDTEFKGYTLRAGTIAVVSPALSHRLDNFYSNPDTFDPDRFAVREEDKKNPFSFLAFGAGKHACIGESFAFVQVKTIWSWLIRNYELELVTKKIEPNFKSMVVGPVPPVTIRYKRKK